jgi:ABC-type transport system substrate-binding protein
MILLKNIGSNAFKIRALARPSMFTKRSAKLKHAISRTATIIVVVVIIIIIAAGGYYALSLPKSSSTTSSSTTSATSGVTTTSTTTSSSSTGTAQIPTSITYETLSTIQFLDPQVSYDIYGASIEQNVYEPLLWFNGANGTAVIPWLAQNFSISNSGHTFTATLRSNIKFADGEVLNSSDIYFTYNRLLVMDGSAPLGHGTQASWIVQQLLNHNLSTTLCACSQTYGNGYVSAVLNENFVQMTGPLTFQLNIMNPNGALPFLLGNLWANIVAPDYVMAQDIALWNQSSLGYTLPYPTLSGNLTQQMTEYFDDYSATCNAGATPKGCAATYLDSSVSGSLGGTGPYTIQSVNTASSIVTLKSNPNYWGGPNGNIMAKIPTVVYKYVPDQTTREIDLKNAAATPGQAMVIDVASTNIYDVADRSTWLNQQKLQSSLSGVTIYGPYTQYATYFIPLDTNVSSPFGGFYSFQPFADLRLRQAFADSVNLSLIDQTVNNNLGQVANELEPPGIPPVGSYNASLPSGYSYSPDQVQSLLLSAMQTPLTHFNFENGTAAPSGLFNNTFGCPTLGAGNRCSSPVSQTVSLVYATGDSVDQSIMNQIAGTINNVSVTYNMGLTVDVTPLPCGQMTSEAFSGQVYAWAESCFGWFDDYPWSLDFLGPIASPGGIYTGPGGWNLAQMGTLWNQAQAASAAGNDSGVVAATNAMAALENKNVMDIWTFYPDIYMVMTSNVQGFYFNPGIYTTGEPQYFAALS